MCRIDVIVERETHVDDGHVAQRQYTLVCYHNCVAGNLDRELRGADHCRANALAGIVYRVRNALVGQRVMEVVRQCFAEIAMRLSLTLEDVFRNATRKRDHIRRWRPRQRLSYKQIAGEFVAFFLSDAGD